MAYRMSIYAWVPGLLAVDREKLGIWQDGSSDFAPDLGGTIIAGRNEETSEVKLLFPSHAEALQC